MSFTLREYLISCFTTKMFSVADSPVLSIYDTKHNNNQLSVTWRDVDSIKSIEFKIDDFDNAERVGDCWFLKSASAKDYDVEVRFYENFNVASHITTFA